MYDSKKKPLRTDMAPLVKYRKKDAARVLQINEMQEGVESKILAVMASFKESPSKMEVLERKLHTAEPASLTVTVTKKGRQPMAGYIVMALLTVAVVGFFAYLLT